MSTIAVLTSTENGANSLSDINANFSALNADKQEKGAGVTGNITAFGTGNVLADTGKTAPTGAFVGTSDTQALTHKDLTDATNSFPATIATLTGTQVLTNKQISARVQTVADAGGTLTPSADANDLVIATALSQATTIAAPTPATNLVQGQKLIIRLKDNGTARALTWNSIYRAGSDVSLPSTTVLSKTVYCGFIYNATDSKWDLVGVVNNI